MRNYILFRSNGATIFDSRDYGVYISGSGIYTAPGRSGEFVSVPGRNGDIWLDNKKWENVIITYPAFMAPVDGRYGNYNTLSDAMTAFKSSLCTMTGYTQIVDSYSVNEGDLQEDYVYRMGIYQGPFEPTIDPEMRTAAFDLSFNCKPFRYHTESVWYIIGHETDEEASITFLNPYGVPQTPLLYLSRTSGYTGNTLSFTVTCDGEQITATITIPSTITVDTVYFDMDSMNCYRLSSGTQVSMNQYTTFSGNEFPTLKGKTNVVTAGGNTEVQIKFLEQLL